MSPPSPVSNSRIFGEGPVVEHSARDGSIGPLSRRAVAIAAWFPECKPVEHGEHRRQPMKPQAGESSVLESRDRGLIEPGQALELGLTQAEGLASVEDPTAEPRERRPDCRIEGLVVANVTAPFANPGHGTKRMARSSSKFTTWRCTRRSRPLIADVSGATAGVPQRPADAATGNPRDPRSRRRPRWPDAATGNGGAG